MLAAGVLLAGCSGEEKKAAPPEVPERLCWGAFDGKTVLPLLGSGKKVTEDTRDAFALPADLDKVTCRVQMDGATTMTAFAWRKPLGSDAFWQAYDALHPDKLDLGRKGLVWDGGATLLYTCRTPTEAFELELRISNGPASIDSAKAKAMNTQLMKDYQDFTRKQLTCAP
ncbi:cell division control 45 family protein [Streptomyces bambusae]|uniref:DUF3558 domain-containing protein n=1 Tax=Streptomyces bambusae TaxID=1550616 RepID=A0ABS6ZEZ4_9ACTN|nr:cell division control 45 family protein [Streptomyces bambusae]MBW5486330.1 hypothetical protein [Streptomyces bambusae]